jgi:hypothetical protein
VEGQHKQKASIKNAEQKSFNERRKVLKKLVSLSLKMMPQGIVLNAKKYTSKKRFLRYFNS